MGKEAVSWRCTDNLVWRRKSAQSTLLTLRAISDSFVTPTGIFVTIQMSMSLPSMSCSACGAACGIDEERGRK